MDRKPLVDLPPRVRPPGHPRAPKTLLHFEGVDYACMVYLNGHLLGEHEGMYEDFAFDVTDLLQTAEHFVLDVLILHAPDEMGQIGRTSQTSTQKSRFGYKWISAPGWSIWASGRMCR